MSTYSKNLFDILGDGEVARPVPVKEEAPVVVDKKSVSKINKDGKFIFLFLDWFSTILDIRTAHYLYSQWRK